VSFIQKRFGEQMDFSKHLFMFEKTSGWLKNQIRNHSSAQFRTRLAAAGMFMVRLKANRAQKAEWISKPVAKVTIGLKFSPL